MLTIPGKYRPLIVAVAVTTIAALSVFVVDLFDIGEDGVADCCATEFDPTPLQQVPAKVLTP